MSAAGRTRRARTARRRSASGTTGFSECGSDRHHRHGSAHRSAAGSRGRTKTASDRRFAP
ncbi:hypothetical protein A33M_0896 [Rhodovulum sp. PH10]|nr:hypothetical protein A33M_0896 [Rhodovulum sp. PH10]